VRRLLLFSFLLGFACASPEAPVSQGRVVLAPPKPPKGEPKQSPEWFDKEIAAALEDLRAGRLEQGIERVLKAKEQSPAGQEALDLDELMRRLNQAVLDLPMLVASVEAPRDPITFGDPVRITVRLENPGSRTVRIPVTVEAGRPSPMDIKARPQVSNTLFVLDVLRSEYDVNAHVVLTRTQLHYPLREDVELPPRATTEITFTIGGAGNERPLEGFRTYTVGGQLRAGRIEIGGLRRYEAIRLRPGMLRSFRPNWEHLANDPVGRIGQALERNAPLHLLTAAALVPRGSRKEAVDTLITSLKGGGPMDLAAFGALAYLTNVDLGNDADAWRGWWTRVKDRFFDEPEEEGAPGEGPRFVK
jgi:hypothetical protein